MVIKPKKSKLIIELDEMWGFVGSKENKQWIWLAIDRATGQIVGFHIGGRGEEDAKNYGYLSLPFIVNTRFVTLIFDMLTRKLYQSVNIELSVKRQGKPVVQSGLIVP